MCSLLLLPACIVKAWHGMMAGSTLQRCGSQEPAAGQLPLYKPWRCTIVVLAAQQGAHCHQGCPNSKAALTSAQQQELIVDSAWM